MNTFHDAVENQVARTANGMKARGSTGDALVDLFFKAGSIRNGDVTPLFIRALADDRDIALRIAQWTRDVRGGAGERKTFRKMLEHLDRTDCEAFRAVVYNVPNIGRWDDLLGDFSEENKAFCYDLILAALNEGNGLCAKWMPRKGPVAVQLRAYFGWTPKYYRKRLVELTRVVEQQMCANDWDSINFNHVPSVASSRYKKAFGRHTENYKQWIEQLKSGDRNAKINANAIFPHDVLKGLFGTYSFELGYGRDHLDVIEQQWNALPNYVGDRNVMPIVDVSGSMYETAGKSKTKCIDVSVALGLYLADKNKGKFHGTFLTFSTVPELVNLRGNIVDKALQITKSNWDMSTNLHAAFDKILDTATRGNVPQSEMPDTLLILSDMQFNHCVKYDDSAIEMIRRKYTNAGYKMPNVVFWNLNAYNNAPVSFNEKGVALVSGFSPSILKSVLSANVEALTPLHIMLSAVMSDRYALDYEAEEHVDRRTLSRPNESNTRTAAAKTYRSGKAETRRYRYG